MSVRQSVRALLREQRRVVLAVSGGIDSMVLLDAATATTPRDRLTVATFDHGTGAAATAAASLVVARAKTHGLEVERGTVPRALHTESEWRAARWSFLRDVAASVGAAAICTAHTADDQIETVLMRVLRGAGARGLAGLLADGGILRPLIRFSRRDVARYARAQGLAWIEDPTNDSPRFFRNRVRHDLLPAMRRVWPGVDAELLKIARRSARWRREVEGYVDAVVDHATRGEAANGLDVAASALAPHDFDSLSVLWPALAAKAGATLDRRGTVRLATFTLAGRIGSRIQVSGGWEVMRARDRFELRRREAAAPTSCLIDASATITWGSWSFQPTEELQNGDRWSAWLPTDQPLRVRAWRAGDVMTHAAEGSPRKVKRLLSDAGVTGHDRARWPVILAGEEIVWIPGVRRSKGLVERSGRPGLAFHCEYRDR